MVEPSEISADLAQIRASQAQQGLDIANIRQSLVILPTVMNGFDTRLGSIDDSVKEVITALFTVMGEFRGHVERLERGQAAITARVDAQFGELSTRLATDEARLDKKRQELDDMQARLHAIEVALASRPTPEQAKATYDGVQHILKHLDRLGLNDATAE